MSHNKSWDFLLWEYQQLPSLPSAGLVSCYLTSSPKGDGSSMAAVGRTGILGDFKAARRGGDFNFGAFSVLRFASSCDIPQNSEILVMGSTRHP